MGFEWNVEQPCLARCGPNIFMVHVDDLLLTGTMKFWTETFPPTMQAKFNISFSVLGEEGTNVSFFRRKIVR